VSAYETVKISMTGGPEHLAALEKSIKAAAVCNVCGGEGRFRCTNCHGKKETKYYCQRCKGKGSTTSSLGAKLVCPACLGKGIEKIVKCEKCKDGYVDCKQCDHKPHPAPSMDDMVGLTACPACEGRGMAFRSAAVVCPACLGLGAKLAPKVDPSKILPDR
jgi:DnaJ-class molecular chaperone